MLSRHLIIPSTAFSRTFSSISQPDVITLNSVIPHAFHQHAKPTLRQIQDLADFIVRANGKLLVLSGAGISTESGIPDYRSEGRAPYNPIKHQTFMSDELSRKRYWARSMVGFKRMGFAKPNRAHFMLTSLEQKGYLSHIITQNVDGLHITADSKKVIELHGSIHHVICTNCNNSVTRLSYQKQLETLNPDLKNPEYTMVRPDGDVDLQKYDYMNFKVPLCYTCEGIMKPDFVFFGDSVPPGTISKVNTIINNCNALLVVGSSLQVWSAFRIVRIISENKKEIAIVNIGQTRADTLTHLKVEGICGEVLPQVVDKLYTKPTITMQS